MKRGQIYRVPAAKIAKDHDPSGDFVYRGMKSAEVCGFVIRRDCDDTLLIVLFRPENLPDKAEVVLEYCDAIQVLREEAARNPVLKAKLEKVKLDYEKD